MYNYYPMLTLCVGVTIFVIYSKVARRYRQCMLFIMVSLVLATVIGEVERSLGDSVKYPTLPPARPILSYLGYTIRPVVALGFVNLAICGIEEPDNFYRRNGSWFRWILYTPAFINAAVMTTMFWSPELSIHYSQDNVFYRGLDLIGFFPHFASEGYIVMTMVVAITFYISSKKYEMLVIVICGVASTVAMLVDTFFQPSISCVSYTAAIYAVLFYLFLHIQAANDDSAKKELELQHQREAIMLSQIQPHFLYNTLGTIEALCHTEPELAADTVHTFSKYLRGNMDSLTQRALIPMEKELQHTSEYTTIEELRFRTLQVHYEIEDIDFEVPALSVQPLVENAIRHGVRGIDPGIVTVRTYYDQESKMHVIEVNDNGVGFDLNGPYTIRTDHIGLRNVQERIESVANGQMTMDSVFGEGTRIQIRIPAQKKPSQV